MKMKYKSYASHECKYHWNHSQKSSTNYHFLQTFNCTWRKNVHF
ncbi:hypothetical protein T06_11330 [Trichinella sp. T6]|nr:hypothetical protein T06_11330 [Trichinella sp. T6]